MAVGTASLTFVDYDGQVGVSSVNTAPVTAANFATLTTAIDAYKDELLTVTLGVVRQTTLTQRTPLAGAGVKPSNPAAQRGNRWIISAWDSSAELAAGVSNPYYLKPFDYEVPTADFSLRVDNRDVVWVEGGTSNVADFDTVVSTFEAFAKSPVGGALQVAQIYASTSSGG